MSGKPLWERPVTYGAVGATQASDMMSYPPPGLRPFRQRTRIGHGEARWAYACTTLLTWGVQRNSGFRVELTDAPAEVTEQTYLPVAFDSDGAPIEPAVTENHESVFAPDGTPLLTPGDTALLAIPFGPFAVKAPARVVYVIDEPNRKGFAYGTLPGHPESGEEAFIVERTEDGSVWLEIRTLSRPSGWFWWMAYPLLRLVQSVYTARYLQSLSGPMDPAIVPVAEARDVAVTARAEAPTRGDDDADPALVDAPPEPIDPAALPVDVSRRLDSAS